MKEKTAEVSETLEVNGIDQIRDIIVGEQLLQWESRFKRIEQELKDLSKSLSKRIGELDQKLLEKHDNVTQVINNSKVELISETENINEKLQGLKQELHKRITELAENKVDKDSIGEVFIQWGQKVKSK